MREIPLELTEETMSVLNRVYANYAKASEQDPDREVGRIMPAGRFGSGSHSQTRAESSYFRMVSIVEAYVDSTSNILFQQHLTARSAPAVRAIILDAQLRASASWAERKEAFRKYHGISIGDCARWSEFDIATDVRNAIAHGLGSLTIRQRSSRTRARVRTLGVKLVDDQLVLTPVAIDKLLEVSSEFVLSFDENVRAQLRQGVR